MIIIFESPDRCGKDTQIKLLKSYFSKRSNILFHELHYTADHTKNLSLEGKYYASKFYYSEMFEILNLLSKNGKNLILNRSHLGEYVYAEKYRGYDGQYVFDLEKKYFDKNLYPNLYFNSYLITFIDMPEELLNREDGNSYSNNIEDKVIEIEKFKELTKLSNIRNKILININMKSIEEVHKEVIGFLYKEII